MNLTARAFSLSLMKPGTRHVAPFVGLAALLLSAGAQAIEFNQLLAHKSAVSFAYKQMNVPLDGGFKRFDGRINFDPAKPALAKAEIDIELASIDTGSEEGNDEVAGKLWFNTRQFPVARFVSTSIKPLDTKTPATFRQEGNLGVFEGSFVLKRGDYGIGEGMWADYGTVANEVQIKFRLVAAAAAGKK